MIGKRILHYEIIDKLGEGGMGVVYKAEDTKLERMVAIKFLSQQTLAKDDERRRFEVEAKAAAALNHPNIATIHAIEKVDDQTFIVMEFVDGQELKSKIAAGPLPLETFFDVAEQIAEGLHEAHEKGIVHRDIKPSNIMLTAKDRVKITDFGLAMIANRTKLTQTGTTLGTVAYMSPEQAQGARVDHRSDIWSFGVMMYEMIVGRLPFEGEYEQAVIYSIMNVTPEPVTSLRTGVPMDLERIIDKAIAKKPNERYQHIDEILVDLRNVRKEYESGTTIASSSIFQKKPTGQSELQKALADLAQQQPEMKPNSGLASHTVGRQREMTKLLAGFESACNGKGRLLCVMGEAGLGKTTLVEAFFNELHQGSQPCLMARGQSSERLGSTEGYLPILEALESMLTSPAGESIAEILKLVAPTWYVEVAPVSLDDSSDARVIADAKAASQERKKRELTAFFQEVSNVRPLILFFDDLHWADLSTIDVLAFLGNRCGAMKLLIIVAYRPAELLLSENQFQQVKLNLQSRQVCHDVVLEFLSLADVNRYFELEFPQHAFPEEFAAVIHKQTEGSPLFMVDLIRNQHDSGVIDRENGRWVLKQSVSDIKSELPESIRSMIERKISKLSESERQMLVAASIQGNEFDSAVLAKVLNRDPAEVEDQLEVLARVHSFVRLLGEREFPDLTPTLRHSFVHILYQNTFYNTLSMTRKATLSLAVAKSLTEFYGEQSFRIAGELAFLYEAGRDFACASDYFSKAADNAIKVYANQEAVTLLEHAIANAERLKAKERTTRIFASAMKLGTARLFGTPEAMKESINDFALAEKVAQEAGDADNQINAICDMAFMLFNLKQTKEAQIQVQRAFKLAQSVQSRLGMAYAQILQTIEPFSVGDLVSVENCCNAAIPVLRQHGISQRTVFHYMAIGSMYELRLEYDKAKEFIEPALAESKKAGHAYWIAQIQFLMGLFLGNQGRISEAMDILKEGLHISELNGGHILLNRLPNTLGWLYSELGDVKTAEKLNLDSIKYSRESRDLEAEANARINLAHDYIAVGEFESAFEQLQTAQELCAKDVNFRWRYNLRTQTELAKYWVSRGDLVKAAHHVSEALESAEKTLSRKYIALSQKVLGDIAALEDRVDDGKKHYQKALATLANHPCPTVEWKILKAFADLARKLKDDATRDELLGRAKAVVQSLADSVTDEKLRQNFLSSKAIREI